MVLNSPADQIEAQEKQSELVFQIRELYGRVTYTHKVHEKCADIYFRRSHTMKIVQIVLSALTTGSLLLAIFGDGKIGTLIGAAFSTGLFGLNLYLKDFDFGELSQKHIAVAARLWNIRELYLSLITDLTTGKISSKKAMEKRDSIQEQLSSIYLNSPRTINQAYEQAQKALKIEEEMTFSCEEIDRLLPEALRLRTNVGSQ